MAKTPYRRMPELLRESKPFVGNSLSAVVYDGVYYVYSYRTVIAIYDPNDGEYGTVYFNEQEYSHTTAHHQRLALSYVGDYAKRHSVVTAIGQAMLFDAHERMRSYA